MKLPLSWIKDYVNIDVAPKELAEALLLSGTKVERIEKSSQDYIFEFEITPNRPDTLSVLGIAREIAALYSEKLKLPTSLNTQPNESQKLPELKVSEEALSPGYTYGAFADIKIGASPSWMKTRLEQSGIRSLNNVVDITNYVMLETGQPMHAFDLSKIKGRMLMRRSKKGEEIITIDKKKRTLSDNAIVIEDENGLIDLAGLMGGSTSEVDKNTNSILLHVPLYDPVLIRRSSNYLGLRTEASNRFEKKLDPNAHRFAFERAAQLLKEEVGAKLASPIVSTGYPVEPNIIVVHPAEINKILGVNLGSGDIEKILLRLGFSAKRQNGHLVVETPTLRTDIKGPVDLAEEVGRLYGYNNLPKQIPSGQLPREERRDLIRELKEFLAKAELREIYSSSLLSEKDLTNIEANLRQTLKVENRLSIDHEYLRPNLLHGLLAALKVNENSSGMLSFFEVGKVFSIEKDKDSLPKQPVSLAVATTKVFIEAKGILESLFVYFFGIGDLSFEETKDPFFEQSALVSLRDRQLGKMGIVKESILEKMGLKTSVSVFEIDIDTAFALARRKVYQPLLKFPTAKEDISLFVPENLNFRKIEEAILKSAGKHLKSVSLEEDTLIDNKRALLVSLEYGKEAGTLTSTELSKLRKSVLESLKKIGVIIRG